MLPKCRVNVQIALKFSKLSIFFYGCLFKNLLNLVFASFEFQKEMILYVFEDALKLCFTTSKFCYADGKDGRGCMETE